MEKQTKNILTQKLIAKDLHFYATAKIRHALVLCGVFAPLCLPASFAFIYFVTWGGDNPVQAFLGIVCAVISSQPLFISLFRLWQGMQERSLLRKGEFEVTVRAVSEKTEKRFYRLGGSYWANVLCFPGFKAYIMKDTAFQLASLKDEYYLVHYRGKNKLALIYPLKAYEYIP